MGADHSSVGGDDGALSRIARSLVRHRSGCVTIVVVDTDREMSALVAFALRQDDHAVLEIHKPDQALAAIARERPSLVILAAYLCGTSDAGLCHTVRVTFRVPMIVINGPATEEDEIAILDAGADAYMTQPLDLRTLRARARALVRWNEQAAKAPATRSARSRPMRASAS